LIGRRYPVRRSRRSQRGVILLMLLIALTLILIAMAVAAPKLAQQIKRDREIEMIHRGTEYARAVKKYYKKFGRYPATIEQLQNTNNIRFLRKAYTDPMAKDGKWRPVRFGEVQLGQQGGGPGTIGGSGGALPPVVGGALNQGGTSQEGPATQPTAGQQGQSSFGTSTNFGPSTSFGAQNSQSGSSPTGQPSGFGQPSAFGGQTFGGGAILGVASTSKAKGFHEYNGKSEYDKWLFVYDPTQDRGGLITGPYNPKAFVGNAAPLGSPAGSPAGQQPGGQTFGSPGFSNSPSPAPNQPSGTQPNNP
jgi:type II secretory pathway pseudopilin PulG